LLRGTVGTVTSVSSGYILRHPYDGTSRPHAVHALKTSQKVSNQLFLIIHSCDMTIITFMLTYRQETHLNPVAESLSLYFIGLHAIRLDFGGTAVINWL